MSASAAGNAAVSAEAPHLVRRMRPHLHGPRAVVCGRDAGELASALAEEGLDVISVPDVAGLGAVENGVAGVVVMSGVEARETEIADAANEASRVLRVGGTLAVTFRPEDAILAVAEALEGPLAVRETFRIGEWPVLLAVRELGTEPRPAADVASRELLRQSGRLAVLEDLVAGLRGGIASRDLHTAELEARAREATARLQQAERSLRTLSAEHERVQDRLAVRARQVEEYQASRTFKVARLLWRVRSRLSRRGPSAETRR